MVVGMQHQQRQPHASPATVLEDATTPCAVSPFLNTPPCKVESNDYVSDGSESSSTSVGSTVVASSMLLSTMATSMYSTERVKLREVNPYLICVLCQGYFVDATSITECLHSFCRSCIVLHLETERSCPICKIQITNSNPHLKLKADKSLQDVVYKIVPGLFAAEMKRRTDFYRVHPDRDAELHPENRGIIVDRLLYSPTDMICVSFEYYDEPNEREDWDSVSSHLVNCKTSESELSSSENNADDNCVKKKYLYCQADVRVLVLKKLLAQKYSLRREHVVELFYNKKFNLLDDFSLMDIAYIYAWKRNSPMEMHFRISIETKVTEPASCVETNTTEGNSSQLSPPVENDVRSEDDSKIQINAEAPKSLVNVSSPNEDVSKINIVKDQHTKLDGKSTTPVSTASIDKDSPVVTSNTPVTVVKTTKSSVPTTTTSATANSIMKGATGVYKNATTDKKSAVRTKQKVPAPLKPTPEKNRAPIQSYLSISSILHPTEKPETSKKPVMKHPRKSIDNVVPVTSPGLTTLAGTTIVPSMKQVTVSVDDSTKSCITVSDSPSSKTLNGVLAVAQSLTTSSTCTTTAISKCESVRTTVTSGVGNIVKVSSVATPNNGRKTPTSATSVTQSTARKTPIVTTLPVIGVGKKTPTEVVSAMTSSSGRKTPVAKTTSTSCNAGIKTSTTPLPSPSGEKTPVMTPIPILSPSKKTSVMGSLPNTGSVMGSLSNTGSVMGSLLNAGRKTPPNTVTTLSSSTVKTPVKITVSTSGSDAKTPTVTTVPALSPNVKVHATVAMPVSNTITKTTIEASNKVPSDKVSTESPKVPVTLSAVPPNTSTTPSSASDSSTSSKNIPVTAVSTSTAINTSKNPPTLVSASSKTPIMSTTSSIAATTAAITTLTKSLTIPSSTSITLSSKSIPPPLITLTSTPTTSTLVTSKELVASQYLPSNTKIPSSLEISFTSSKDVKTSLTNSKDSKASPNAQKMVQQNFANGATVNGTTKNSHFVGKKSDSDGAKGILKRPHNDDKKPENDKKICRKNNEISVSTNGTSTKKIFSRDILPEVSITLNPHPEQNKRITPETSYDVSCFKPNRLPPLTPINSPMCKNIQNSPIKNLNNKLTSGVRIARNPQSSNASIKDRSKPSDKEKMNGEPEAKKPCLENGLQQNGGASESNKKSKSPSVESLKSDDAKVSPSTAKKEARHSIPKLIDINAAPYSKLMAQDAKSRLQFLNSLQIKPPTPTENAKNSEDALDLSSPSSKSPFSDKSDTSPDKKKIIPSVPPLMIPVTMNKNDTKSSLTKTSPTMPKIERKPSPIAKLDKSPARKPEFRLDNGSPSTPTSKSFSPIFSKTPSSIGSLHYSPPDFYQSAASLNYLRQQREFQKFFSPFFNGFNLEATSAAMMREDWIKRALQQGALPSHPLFHSNLKPPTPTSEAQFHVKK